MRIVAIVTSIAATGTVAFTPPSGKTFRRHYISSNGNVGKKNNNPPAPPPRGPKHSSFWSDDENDDDAKMMGGGFILLASTIGTEETNEDENETRNKTCANLDIRGGSTTSKPKKTEANSLLVAGSKTTMTKTANYWSDALESTSHLLGTPIRFLQSKLPISPLSKKERQQKEQDEFILEQLATTKIASVTAPNSTVLPPSVLEIAAKRSGLLGGTLNSASVQHLARSLKQWYNTKGYILHAITGATLQPETKTAVITVQEPILHSEPVHIQFAKEMIVDEEQPGNLLTYRQYRDRFLKRSLRKDASESIPAKSELNTTFVATTGRTRPEVLAKTLRLHPGKPFRWDGSRWNRIANSGIFSRVLRASPERMRDGTVQLNVIAQEPPLRNLEYGISKSLYTGGWEGELEFEHGNVLGGGESLGLVVRRGARDAEPSVRLRFRDDKFGLEGGYTLEVFNDYIAVNEGEEGHTGGDNGGYATGNGVDSQEAGFGGTNDADQEGTDAVTPTLPAGAASVVSGPASSLSYDDDALLCRKGTSVRFQNFFSSKFIERNSLSASLERTSTRTGRHESIGSTTLDVGPFHKDLPLDARTNLQTSFTVGSRLGGGGDNDNDSKSSFLNWQILPYSAATATTRQIFPLLTDTSNSGRPGSGRPVQLALEHSAMSSTRNLPRHEANAAGFAARVRGYSSSSNGPVSSSLVGTTELRIPVMLPTDKVAQDCSLVVFGDWMIGSSRKSLLKGGGGVGSGRGGLEKRQFRKSSVGVGLRKSIQGIPVKYDVCFTRDGKIGAFFGLGSDFDV